MSNWYSITTHYASIHEKMETAPLQQMYLTCPKESPLEIYRCVSHCPGGRPGSCDAGRIGVTCGECPQNEFIQDETWHRQKIRRPTGYNRLPVRSKSTGESFVDFTTLELAVDRAYRKLLSYSGMLAFGSWAIDSLLAHSAKRNKREGSNFHARALYCAFNMFTLMATLLKNKSN